MATRSQWVVNKTEVASGDGLVTTMYPHATEAGAEILAAAGLRALGHDLDVREESFSSTYFARPNGITIDPDTGVLRGGVNQFKPAMAMGL